MRGLAPDTSELGREYLPHSFFSVNILSGPWWPKAEPAVTGGLSRGCLKPLAGGRWQPTLKRKCAFRTIGPHRLRSPSYSALGHHSLPKGSPGLDGLRSTRWTTFWTRLLRTWYERTSKRIGSTRRRKFRKVEVLADCSLSCLLSQVSKYWSIYTACITAHRSPHIAQPLPTSTEPHLRTPQTPPTLPQWAKATSLSWWPLYSLPATVFLCFPVPKPPGFSESCGNLYTP